jgi:hypothetical protein
MELLVHLILGAKDADKALSYLDASIWNKMGEWFLEHK